jgi:hypothetical protein
MTRVSASVVVGADWLVSSVTVILLIVGHEPAFRLFADGGLRLPVILRKPQTSESPPRAAIRSLRLSREDVAARRIQAQADGLAPATAARRAG